MATREQLIQAGYINPILLLHPLSGWCMVDDVPLNDCMKQHAAILTDGALTPEHTVLAKWPSSIYYGGPATHENTILAEWPSSSMYFGGPTTPEHIIHAESLSSVYYVGLTEFMWHASSSGEDMAAAE